MATIKMPISKVKSPFYPPCEIKCELQNGVSIPTYHSKHNQLRVKPTHGKTTLCKHNQLMVKPTKATIGYLPITTTITTNQTHSLAATATTTTTMTTSQNQTTHHHKIPPFKHKPKSLTPNKIKQTKEKWVGKSRGSDGGRSHSHRSTHQQTIKLETHQTQNLAKPMNNP